MFDNIPSVTQSKPEDPPRVPTVAESLKPLVDLFEKTRRAAFQMGLALGFVIGIVLMALINLVIR